MILVVSINQGYYVHTLTHSQRDREVFVYHIIHSQ